MPAHPFITIDHVAVWYPIRTGLLGSFASEKEKKYVKAVDGVNLTIQRGEILGVIGESGCGKSTLGRVLVRLENPTKGDVLIDNEPVHELIARDAKKFHRMVQIVFQNPFDTFTPRDRIQQILMRPLRNHGIGANDEERAQICLAALESGGLFPAADILKRFPHELSGGQLQRVSILRSMLLDPRFIVADEPVSMLDVSVRADIINMLVNLSRKKQAALVFISHDIALTRYISDCVAVMYLGRIVELGQADEIIRSPLHPYTRALISNCASINLDDTTEKIDIDGEPPTPINPGPGCYFADRCFMRQERCFKEYPPMREIAPGHTASCFYI
jgi:peptide/nickel transport system ATP-binding protein